MKLDERHYAVMADLMEGLPRTEIAAKHGIHETTVSLWQRTPEFAEALQELRNQAAQQVHELMSSKFLEEAPRSFETITNLRDRSQSDRIRLSAAVDLLDRAGFRAVEQQRVTHEHILSPEFAAILRTALQDEKQIIDVKADLITELPERRE